MSNWYYSKSRCRLYNTRNPHRLFEQWWSSNLVDNYINWAAHIYVYESQLNIHYPQVQPFVLPYLDTVHRFAPQTNPLMDVVVAKPTLKLASTWKYHKEGPHKKNQTGNNILTFLFSKSYSAFISRDLSPPYYICICHHVTTLSAANSNGSGLEWPANTWWEKSYTLSLEKRKRY